MGSPIVSVNQTIFIPVTGDHLRRRFAQLSIGLVLFGVGIGFMLQSGLGLTPWDVLHEGLAIGFGMSIGVWSIIVSVFVLLLWIPLRERPGVGTLMNAVIIGVVIDLIALVVPEATSAVAAVFLMVAGVALIGFASGLYIGANLGPGPRDGLMTAIARRGVSIRLTRALLEVAVLAAGWALGGTVGIGTLLYAATIGPLVHFFLPRWTIDPGVAGARWDHPAR